MPKERIYFCQGCSAVLKRRVEYCPHCGDVQIYEDECENCGAAITENDEECPECYETIYTDEEKERYCPWCGYNLDTDGRDLGLKYCNGVDCGKELGGLIRYSENTGEPLSVEEILSKMIMLKKLPTGYLVFIMKYMKGTFPPLLTVCFTFMIKQANIL
jgi:RNA polymerase subunit RPABC4/transcription elongation factor Spt4